MTPVTVVIHPERDGKPVPGAGGWPVTRRVELGVPGDVTARSVWLAVKRAIPPSAKISGTVFKVGSNWHARVEGYEG